MRPLKCLCFAITKCDCIRVLPQVNSDKPNSSFIQLTCLTLLSLPLSFFHSIFSSCFLFQSGGGSVLVCGGTLQGVNGYFFVSQGCWAGKPDAYSSICLYRSWIDRVMSSMTPTVGPYTTNTPNTPPPPPPPLHQITGPPHKKKLILC